MLWPSSLILAPLLTVREVTVTELQSFNNFETLSLLSVQLERHYKGDQL